MPRKPSTPQLKASETCEGSSLPTSETWASYCLCMMAPDLRREAARSPDLRWENICQSTGSELSRANQKGREIRSPKVKNESCFKISGIRTGLSSLSPGGKNTVAIYIRLELQNIILLFNKPEENPPTAHHHPPPPTSLSNIRRQQHVCPGSWTLHLQTLQSHLLWGAQQKESFKAGARSENDWSVRFSNVADSVCKLERG